MENFINPIDINITGKTENIFRKPRPEIEFTFDYEVNKIYIQKMKIIFQYYMTNKQKVNINLYNYKKKKK